MAVKVRKRHLSFFDTVQFTVSPLGYTPSTLLGKHGSKPRNLHIAEVFHDAGFIEAWGRGYEKIEESFAAAGLPMPEIEASQGGVWVCIKRRNPFTDVGVNVGDNVGEVSETKLSERQRHILSLVLNDPTISAKRMSEMLSVNKRAIERDIDYLRKTEQIFREGSDNHGHWVVVKPE